MSIKIEGKVALITGSNRGIGKAIVESFVQNGASKIYLGVRSEKKADELVEKYGDKVKPLVIDYEKPETIEDAAKEASDVEVVVSNAGILLGAKIFADDVIEKFEKELNINVYGLLRMAKAFAPVLKKNGGGAFVQINSVASLRSFPDFATYPASKAASYSFTQAILKAFQEQNTHTLSVHPGPIETDMANDAGIEDCDPPSVVGDGIVEALAKGDFHLFPDKMAKEMGDAYESFAQSVVLSEQ